MHSETVVRDIPAKLDRSWPEYRALREVLEGCNRRARKIGRLDWKSGTAAAKREEIKRKGL
jgi:hypothetical protein